MITDHDIAELCADIYLAATWFQWAIRNEPGNLCLRKTAWWGWEDSNF